MSMKLDAENAILWAKLKKYRQFILFNYFLSLYDSTIKLKVPLKKLWKRFTKYNLNLDKKIRLIINVMSFFIIFKKRGI